MTTSPSPSLPPAAELRATPTPDLAWTWFQQSQDADDSLLAFAELACQWGIHQETTACVHALEASGNSLSAEILRQRCQHQPPTLKQAALMEWRALAAGGLDTREFTLAMATVRQALEALPHG
jgi:hypothetical protein